MKPLLLFTLITLALASVTQASISVIGNLARTSTLKPGDSFEGVILVRNSDKEAADIRVLQCDYLFQADGSNDYADAGQTARSNAGWITVTPSRARIAPGESLPIRYKGKAPADPKLQGTYWSMILVQPNSVGALAPDGRPNEVAVGLSTTIRFAVQIVTEFGNSGTRSLRVADKRLVQGEGKRALQLDIENDGERLLIPQMTVELFDGTGASIGRFEAGRARIYPGCSIRAKADLTAVPAGKYSAMVLLDSGDAQVMGAQYDLELAP
ncbi:MAG TPA: hypothetical protein VM940_06995 [Chthoniobacterales bacterium]|jgi:P pilus assembly chaperone PapD|nr:hypothetical protein [Chthoniobacterales bacterium]